MPLNVEVWRDGKPVRDLEWDHTMLSVVYTTAVKDANPNFEFNPGETFGSLGPNEFVDFSQAPIYYLKIPKVTLLSKGSQKLKRTYRYELKKVDETLPPRIIELRAGDELRAWRSHKS